MWISRSNHDLCATGHSQSFTTRLQMSSEKWAKKIIQDSDVAPVRERLQRQTLRGYPPKVHKTPLFSHLLNTAMVLWCKFLP